MRQVTEVSGRTVLLCFTAPWCRHSRAMRQALRELAEQEKGGVQVVEIDADAYPAIANDYGLTKVPTTVFYTEGVKLRSIEGAYTAESLGRYLHALLTQEETDEEP
jgi:thioredoxin-like negative regulator of GroEL